MTNGFSIHISSNQIDIASYLEESYDCLHIQTSEVEILVEGVILNRKKLLRSYALSDFKTLMLELFAQKKQNLIQELEGEFRGFIQDKNNKKLFVFTNPTSTQRVFYGKFLDQIFIDTNLIRLKNQLQKAKIIPHPKVESLYQLLVLGGMLENFTILENVFKLYDGHFLNINLETLHLQEQIYFSTFQEPYYKKSKEKAYQEIHEIFSESVLMEYEKDEELGADHLALLSGGLDSRIAMMYAIQQGKKPDNVLCFSQSNYFDHQISEKIAQDYQLHYEFIPLDGGSFLKKIDQLTTLSEGLVFYPGAIHAQHAMDHLQYQNFKIFHSGQIGDGILGGFNSAPTKEKPGHFKMVFDETFFAKIEDLFNASLKKYESQETCLIRNLAYNRVLLGAHVFQQKAYQTSPFMTKDFLKFAMALPESWKYQHHFYIDWISKYCPEATKYTWERTLMKPNAKWKTLLGDRFVKPVFVKLNEKILNTPQKANMNPYPAYFANSPDLQVFYQNYFDENKDRLQNYPELLGDVETLFARADFYSKAQAVNILAIFKLFF